MSTKLNRREWSSLALTGLAGLLIPSAFSSCNTTSSIPASLKGTAAAADAKNFGVVLGAQTYSFRDRSLDDTIKAMTELEIKSCELWEGHIEPWELKWKRNTPVADAQRKRQELEKWRNALTMEDIKAIRAKFDNAGIAIQAYNGSIKDNMSEKGLELVFKIAQALGTDIITTSATVSVMKRVDPYAKKYNIKVGMHNHSHTEKPNEFSSPDSFARGMAGLSDKIAINLDIGHFTAANFDAIDFMRQHHQKILSIHLKDRKKDQGPNVPFGEGDTPIIEVLKLIRDNKWPIPANIEYEYKGADTIAEVKKCLDYCKQALKA